MNKWISVKDRLPLPRVTIIVSTDEYVEPIIAYYLKNIDRWYEYDFGAFIADPYSELKYVTHWMPLPEPPGEHVID